MRLNAIVWLCAVIYGTGCFGQQPILSTGTPSGAEAGFSEASQPTLDPLPDWWPRHAPIDRVGFELGTMGLMRETPDDQILAIDENFNELLNANELQGSMQFGLRALVDVYQVSRLMGGTDLQFGYFGINSLDATRTLLAQEVSPVFFNSVPVNPLTSSNLIYSTNIYSGEANLRFRNSRRIQPLAGLRFLKVEDTFDAFDFTGSGRLGGFSLTNNTMFGGHFGGQATLLRIRNFDWFAAGKYGVLNNDVEGSAEAADISGNNVVKNFNDSITSSLVDAETGLIYDFVGGLRFKVSYQYLFASKVATGLDQNESVRLLSPGESVRFNSQLWQGLNLSALFSF